MGLRVEITVIFVLELLPLTFHFSLKLYIYAMAPCNPSLELAIIRVLFACMKTNNLKQLLITSSLDERELQPLELGNFRDHQYATRTRKEKGFLLASHQ